MPEQIDLAAQLLSDIIAEVPDLDIKSEEDTKIKIINRILSNVLGWNGIDDIKYEANADGIFADYKIFLSGLTKIALEAKCIGKLKLNTVQDKLSHYKIKGPALREVSAEISQTFQYGSRLGAPICVLTDGNVWIIFKTFSDGVSYFEQEAFTFHSINAVFENFSEFYELLSKECVSQRLYATVFDKMKHGRLSLNRELYTAIAQDEIKLLPQSDMAFDVDRIFKAFFQKLTGDQDEELLVECFVDTKESRFADYSIEKITNHIISNIRKENIDITDQLQEAVSDTIESELGETIFIIGPTGAGKSTFITRFFSKTLNKDVRDSCIVTRINFIKHTGDLDVQLDWITEQIIASLEKQIFESGQADWESLRGLYFDIYQRRSQGVDKLLYEKDKPAFQLKFSSVIEEHVETKREDYLQRLLKNIVNNRKKLPVIVIDNTDEFSIDVKTKLFQYFNALKLQCGHMLLVFPITDKSAWSFFRTEISNIHTSKSFALPTPPPREVFRRRIDFIKAKIEAEAISHAGEQRASYFTTKGIRVQFENLAKFVAVIETLFVDDETLSTLVGELANYNIRVALALSNRIMASPILDVDALVKSYISGRSAIPERYKIIKSLICGRYSHQWKDVAEIFSIFDSQKNYVTSPLIYIRVLGYLNELKRNSKTVDQMYITVDSVLEYFDPLLSSEPAIFECLKTLWESQLIDSFDPSGGVFGSDQRVGITPRGQAHLRLALNDWSFVGELALTAELDNESVAREIRSIYRSDLSDRRRMAQIRKRFVKYMLEEDATFVGLNVADDIYKSQRDIVDRLERVQGGRKVGVVSASEFNSDRIYFGRVEFFDEKKGFGFVYITQMSASAHLRKALVSEKGIKLFDGAEVSVKINRNEKGLFITDISAIENTLDQLEFVGNIIKVHPERGYAFIKVDSKRDVFLHFSIVEDGQVNLIREGQWIKISAVQDDQGRLRAENVLELPSAPPTPPAT